MCNAVHDHGGRSEPGATTAAPKPYDPTMPIDLSGTPGVTPQQQAAAENLIATTLVQLPQWSDHKVAEAFGFKSIGDANTGHEHFIQWDWINDDVILDPDQPESLVYEPQPDGSKKLVSAMYMLPDDVALDDVPDIGGALMQWHVHDDLCFTNDPVQPRVAGQTNAAGGCCERPGEVRPEPDDPRLDHSPPVWARSPRSKVSAPVRSRRVRNDSATTSTAADDRPSALGPRLPGGRLRRDRRPIADIARA